MIYNDIHCSGILFILMTTLDAFLALESVFLQIHRDNYMSPESSTCHTHVGNKINIVHVL